MAMGQFECWVEPHRGAVVRMEGQLRQLGKTLLRRGLEVSNGSGGGCNLQSDRKGRGS